MATKDTKIIFSGLSSDGKIASVLLAELLARRLRRHTGGDIWNAQSIPSMKVCHMLYQAVTTGFASFS